MSPYCGSSGEIITRPCPVKSWADIVREPVCCLLPSGHRCDDNSLRHFWDCVERKDRDRSDYDGYYKAHWNRRTIPPHTNFVMSLSLYSCTAKADTTMEEDRDIILGILANTSHATFGGKKVNCYCLFKTITETRLTPADPTWDDLGTSLLGL